MREENFDELQGEGKQQSRLLSPKTDRARAHGALGIIHDSSRKNTIKQIFSVTELILLDAIGAADNTLGPVVLTMTSY